MSHPIILAPMAGGPSTPELMAEVANAGGLSTLAAGYLSAAELDDIYTATRELTDGSLGINLFVPPSYPVDTAISDAVRSTLESISEAVGAEAPTATLPDATVYRDQVDIAVSTDAALVSFTFGLPSPDDVAKLHASGKVVAATANTIEEAEQVATSGCDVVILQGFEAGAHRGGLSDRGDRHVGLISLLEQAQTRLSIDVIASGGVVSGAGIAACLALGANAVQIGTAFLVTAESGASDEWKKAVLASSDTDTTVTAAITGKGARGIANPLANRMEDGADELPMYPVLNGYTTQIRRAARELGDPDYQSLWAGQSGGVTQPGTARGTFDRLVAELAETVDRFES